MFDDISSTQWYLYSFLISNDKKVEIDKEISFVEYLASFWNAEAVKKIQASRESKNSSSFKDDEEIKEFIRDSDFKNNPLIDAIVKLKNMESKGASNQEVQAGRRESRRMPTDLSSINKTLGSFNKGE